MRPLLLAVLLLLPAPAFAQADAVGLFLSSEGLEAGTVTLSPLETGGVRLEGQVIGLAPIEHALVLHETGDCDPSTGFASAGAASPQGPILVGTPDETGTLVLEAEIAGLSLREEDPGYLFDADAAALVLYEGPDASGRAFACAAIEAAPLTR